MSTSNTLPRLLAELFEKNKNMNAIGWIANDQMRTMTTEKYRSLIEELAMALEKVGLEAQDKVSILADTSKEWHLMDMATICSRGCVAPIYPTYTSEEVLYILNHSEAKVLFTDKNSQVEKLVEIKDEAKFLKTVVTTEAIPSELHVTLKDNFDFYTLEEFHALGAKNLEGNTEYLNQKIEQVVPEDLASIVYTSGTTGEPKGAMITNKAFSQMLRNLTASLGTSVTSSDRTLTFLPLSHVLGRCDSMLHLALGCEIVYAESIDKIVDNLAIAKPTIMIAVPRIFEKVYARIMGMIEEGSFVKKKIFAWANEVSNKYFHIIETDRSPSPHLIVQRNLAYKLVFNKIYNRFGGRIRFFVSGGAPLADEINKFLRNANLTILEGYGLTETIAPCAVNSPAKQIVGTVGLPVGDVQFKFDDDGEILIKSDALFCGYYKNEEATKDSFTEDGWFRSGDIGMLVQDGYLKITDRKKDIIITSGGKNVAPQKIENMMKTKKYISQFMVVGDRKKFLTGICSIEKETFADMLEELGLSPNCSTMELSKNSKVRELVQANIDEVNEELAQFETIKKFYLAPVEFSIDGGQLTPSMKLKKKVILKTYGDEIEKMYN